MFSFKELNLSGVEVSSAGATLKPGRHAVEVIEATVKDTKANGKMLEIKLNSLEGEGAIRMWINLHVPSSQEATRIGREQLKALLVFGGHPSPDKPGDVATLKGLTVGVSVGSEEYTDKNGNKRDGSKVKSFFPATDIDPKYAGKSKPKTTGGLDDMDDDIPFE